MKLEGVCAKPNLYSCTSGCRVSLFLFFKINLDFGYVNTLSKGTLWKTVPREFFSRLAHRDNRRTWRPQNGSRTCIHAQSRALNSRRVSTSLRHRPHVSHCPLAYGFNPNGDESEWPNGFAFNRECLKTQIVPNTLITTFAVKTLPV